MSYILSHHNLIPANYLLKDQLEKLFSPPSCSQVQKRPADFYYLLAPFVSALTKFPSKIIGNLAFVNLYIRKALDSVIKSSALFENSF